MVDKRKIQTIYNSAVSEACHSQAIPERLAIQKKQLLGRTQEPIQEETKRID